MKVIDFGAVKEIVNQHPERKTTVSYSGGREKETRLSYCAHPIEGPGFRITVDFKDIHSAGYKLGECNNYFPPTVARIFLESNLKRIVVRESIPGLREDFRKDLEEITRRCESVTGLDTLYVTC